MSVIFSRNRKRAGGVKSKYYIDAYAIKPGIKPWCLETDQRQAASQLSLQKIKVLINIITEMLIVYPKHGE